MPSMPNRTFPTYQAAAAYLASVGATVRRDKSSANQHSFQSAAGWWRVTARRNDFLLEGPSPTCLACSL